MHTGTQPAHRAETEEFVRARFGLFVHYGLYSLPGRGEWVMNRERMSPDAMCRLAERFDARRFDAGRICDLACEAGMRYVTFTTMHHDGFRLYETELSDFHARRFAGRDLVEEMVSAARERGLRVALYHSLNNWHDRPDAADALESADAYETFVARTHERILELVTRFRPVDTLWYDGWWPFDAAGWRAKEMNRAVRAVQPQILFNGRNGLPGDFGTPEGHMTAPQPWRPWEACMTLNQHWGYHRGDRAWKAPADVVQMLAAAASGRGNLLLNIGPRGDGTIPAASVRVLEQIGHWLRVNGEAFFDTDAFTFGLNSREGHNGDWNHNGPFTLRGRALYQWVRFWPGRELVVAGLDTPVESVEWLGHGPCTFRQEDGKVTVTGLPVRAPDPIGPVFRFEALRPPSLSLGGGMRVPKAPHPPYDPCPSDIAHA